MCGLFGFAFKQRPGIQLTALLADGMDARGGQAWGYLNALNGHTVKGLKRISRHARRIGMLSHCMAHTRYATQGANTVMNAHPFEAIGVRGKIVLAHNGQIYNGAPSYAVDSMELADRVAAGLASEDLRGYGTVTWYEYRNPRRIYLARLTDSGALSVALTSRGPVYASTKEAVEKSCEMARLKIMQFYSVAVGVVHYLDSSGLFTTNRPHVKLSQAGYADSWRGGVVTRDMWAKRFSTDEKKDEDLPIIDGGLVVEDAGLRAQIEKDLCDVGYSPDALAGVSTGELCDAWDREFSPTGGKV